MSFRLKIVLGLVSIQAALLLVLVANNLHFLQKTNDAELTKRAHVTATLFASATKNAVLASDMASLESSVNEALSNPDLVYIRVSDSRGILMQAGDPQALARPFEEDKLIGDVRDGVFDVGANIIVAGSVLGRVEIGISVVSLHLSLLEARNQALTIAALAIAALTLFSYLIGKYLSHRLEALAKGSRQLALGDLGYQISVKGSDELARAARAFNKMSRELLLAESERRLVEAELANYSDSLELLVSKRTKALSETNATLHQTNLELESAHNQILQSEKMASIGQLSAGVAHEINNPIAFVLSNMSSLERYLKQFMQVLAAYEKSDPVLAQFEAHRKEIADIKQAVDLDFLKEDMTDLLAESNAGLMRVKKIVQNLKDFSYFSAGEWQFADIHHGLDSTLEIIANELKYKATVIKAYGELPEVECMAPELNQVFMNLLMNASHAIKEKGEITISTGLEGEGVWIDIADNGGGIPPENLQRIFDPFFTTKPVGLGTGLGLSISYGIIQTHQGRIEVTSEVGSGTRFHIWLPLHQPLRQ
ncbi:ATP-binding protein [Herbaspirillum sp. RTI4]|uniref:ATP-binding protein n=1 Tax=Herbaspirillum sp. RTI4 TaxID=3048640 RepID=UPI002AB3F347|nr:ATP-binding protein [Herbaspirillum sp. RTI4]MDY7577649.1 ATP-binding protein [Herbaspirillum sp. RTI4]MEA9982185.1 ATP-binding protein [Herbaspirillum sp. RTI4]